jgi:hypothetical protein
MESYEGSCRDKKARTAFMENMIHSNRWIVVSELHCYLNLSHGTLISSVQDLGFNKVCAFWVL